jgi:hypothetical protein
MTGRFTAAIATAKSDQAGSHTEKPEVNVTVKEIKQCIYRCLFLVALSSLVL